MDLYEDPAKWDAERTEEERAHEAAGELGNSGTDVR